MSAQTSPLLTQCPVCQSAYQEGEIRLLSERGPTRLFHCSCQQCGNAVMAIVLENSGWVSSVGVVTDLMAQDALRFQGKPVISPDECIYFHRFLEAESRDLCLRLKTS